MVFYALIGLFVVGVVTRMIRSIIERRRTTELLLVWRAEKEAELAERRRRLIAGEIPYEELELEERYAYWKARDDREKMLEVMKEEAREFIPGDRVVGEDYRVFIKERVEPATNEVELMRIYREVMNNLALPGHYWEFAEFETKRGNDDVAFYLLQRGAKKGDWNCQEKCRTMHRTCRGGSVCGESEFDKYKKRVHEYGQKIKETCAYSQIKTGEDYEGFVGRCLNNLGLECEYTKKSGDYGADIITTVNGYRIAIQCKFYSGPVGYHAVQEINAAREIYKSDIACVVTNASYSKQAICGAQGLNVVLLSHVELQEFVEKIRGLSHKNSPSAVDVSPKENGAFLRAKALRRKKIYSRWDVQRLIDRGVLTTEQEIRAAYDEIRENRKHMVM